MLSAGLVPDKFGRVLAAPGIGILVCHLYHSYGGLQLPVRDNTIAVG